ncbi:MAG TPA: response regulator [Candidatus Binataceae bacterium]|nr:response regulator [Candidatus Binataceae bacterium]
MNQSPKILLIEDDADLADAIAEILAIEGYRIVYASDGMAALALLSETDLPDLILLDLMMPKMNGWEFRAAQQSDQRLARIPVVVLSATGERARPIDATRIVRKPVSLETLLATVRELTSERGRD